MRPDTNAFAHLFSTQIRVLLLALSLVAGSVSAHACSGVEGKPFRQLLTDRGSVAIVRVVEQRLKHDDRDVRSSKPDGLQVYILSRVEVIARIEVIEVLTGAEPVLREISYASHWCGGHRLDPGGYYVVVVDDDTEHLTLGYSDQSVLGLGQEYSEAEGTAESTSLIIQALTEYARTGVFPDEAELPLRSFLVLAMQGFQAPSAEVYLRRSSER